VGAQKLSWTVAARGLPIVRLACVANLTVNGKTHSDGMCNPAVHIISLKHESRARVLRKNKAAWLTGNV